MHRLKLKMNQSKTEVLLLTTKHMRPLIPDAVTVTVGDCDVSISEAVRYIGVVFDRHMSMEDHVTALCKTTLCHLSAITRMRKSLSQESCQQLVHALVTSRLDYANALLSGLPMKLIKKLQRVQNVAARVVTYTRRAAHITPVLKTLHWLPLQFRITFKICLLVHKCIHGCAPSYLTELISLRHNAHDLRTTGTFLADVPRATTNLSQRTFGVAGPQQWNALPASIRREPNLVTFKRKLKTYLFTLAFN